MRGIIDRRRAHPAELREWIVAHVRNHQLPYGLWNFTTAELSSTLRISKKTLYRLFDSKRDIVRAVMTAELEEIATSTADPQAEPGSAPRDKLRTRVQRSIWALDRIETLFGALRTLDPELWREAEDYRRARVIEPLRDSLRSVIGTACMPSGTDIDSVVEIVVVLAVGSSSRQSDRFTQMPSTALFADFARILTQGLCARTSEYRSPYCRDAKNCHPSSEYKDYLL